MNLSQDLSRYPKAQREARRVAEHLKAALGTASPVTEIATVADTSFHISSGIVNATTHRGPIRVVGVPYQTVVPGMQIYARRLTSRGITSYVFDGYAPPVLNIGTQSGSLYVKSSGSPAAASTGTMLVLPGTATAPYTVIPSSPPASGWFWSFFVYLTALPPVGKYAVLMDMPMINGSNTMTGGLQIVYNSDGQLATQQYNSSGGLSATYIQSFQSIAPHHIWFVVCQIGNGFAVNGIQSDAMGIGNVFANNVVTAGNYAMFLLSDYGGNNAPPIGSWISKVSFGCNYASGAAVWPYPLNGTYPTNDSSILTGNAALGSGLTVYNRYLISDNGNSPTSVKDTGLANVTLSNFGDTYLITGPY